MTRNPFSLAHILPLIVMAFVAGGLVANATFAMVVLLPAQLLGFELTLTVNMGLIIFLVGGIIGIVQIARDKPDESDH